jgi:hypothetical protein
LAYLGSFLGIESLLNDIWLPSFSLGVNKVTNFLEISVDRFGAPSFAPYLLVDPIILAYIKSPTSFMDTLPNAAGFVALLSLKKVCVRKIFSLKNSPPLFS